MSTDLTPADARHHSRPGHCLAGGSIQRLIVSLSFANVSIAYGMTSAIGGVVIAIVAAVGRGRSRPQIPLWVLIYVLWCILSLSWTVEHSATFAEAVRVTIFTTTGILLARRYCWHFVGHCVALAVAVIGAISLVMLAVDPVTALMGSDLRGPVSHKNTLGFVSAMGLVCSILLAKTGYRRTFYLVLAALDAWVLLLSNSMTSTVGAAVGVFVGFSVSALNRFAGPKRALYLSGITAALIAMLLWVQWNLAEVTGLVGRNPTFTGRVPIWGVILKAIGERPVTGFGMGAPWTLDSPLRARFDSEVGFDFAGAHNGFLDAALQLGVFGLLFFLMVLFTALRRVTRRDFGLLANSWGSGLLAFFIFHCFSEPLIMTYLGWIIIVFFTCMTPCQGTPQPAPATDSPYNNHPA